MMLSTTSLQHGCRMENRWCLQEANPDMAHGSTCRIWKAENHARSMRKEQRRHSSKFRWTEIWWPLSARTGTPRFSPRAAVTRSQYPGFKSTNVSQDLRRMENRSSRTTQLDCLV